MKKLFLDIYRNDPKKVRRVLLLEIISALTAGIGIVMLIPMLSILDISSGSIEMPEFVAGIMATVPKQVQIFVILIIYIVLLSLKAFVDRTLGVWKAQLVQSYTASLRTQFYKAVIEAKWECFISYPRSELLDLFVAETSLISQNTAKLTTLISITISIFVKACVALLVSVPLTIAVVLFGALFALAFRKIRGRSRARGAEIRKASAVFMQEIANQMNGVKEIRSYGIEKERYAYFKAVTDDYSNKNVEIAKLAATPEMLMSIGAAVMIAVIFYLAMQVLRIDVGRIAVLIYIFSKLWPGLSSIQAFAQSVISVEPVYDYLKKVTDDLSRNSDVEEQKSELEFHFHDSITFDKVSFAYETAQTDILCDVSMQIKSGEITAFLGKSGAGKSTLVDLLLGFLSATRGTIRIDGSPLNRSSFSAWRNTVSYVPQDPILLNDTIRENLLCFHPGAKEEDILSALKKSLAWEFIEKLPDGINTVIGERGVRLSGGECQRIVLARAILGNPQIVVLDEATSALDSESEGMIAKSICALKGTTTVILVAHRLSLVQYADRVIVVDNGAISENGSYQALASNPDGYLAKMLRFGGEL